MFKNNKYFKIYTQLVEKAKSRINVECDLRMEAHHIVPRSMGGADDSSNMVLFTLREHYIAHWLLSKCCVETLHAARMKTAFMLMSGRAINGGVRVISRVYARIKTEKLLNQFRIDCYNPETLEYKTFNLISDEDIPSPWIKKGKPKSEEHKDKIRTAHIGKTKNQEKARGKRWYCNPNTGEKTQVLVGQIVPEGFIPGVGDNKTNTGYRSWFCEATGEYRSAKECPGEGWIRKGKPKSPDAIKNSQESLAQKRAAGLTKTVKGKSWIHNPITGESARLDSDSPVPDGWVVGVSPSHKENMNGRKLGRKQTATQKEAVRLANAKSYRITFNNGGQRVFIKKGMREISEELNMSKHTIENIRHGNISGYKHGISKIELIDV